MMQGHVLRGHCHLDETWTFHMKCLHLALHRRRPKFLAYLLTRRLVMMMTTLMTIMVVVKKLIWQLNEAQTPQFAI